MRLARLVRSRRASGGEMDAAGVLVQSWLPVMTGLSGPAG